jgi:cell division protein FtsQ
MTRKQAKRRKVQKSERFRLPKIRLARILTPLIACGIIATSYQLSATLLDRPIRSITIEGPFQRVSALQIEETISGALSDGFLSANLSEIQQQIVALPWIDQANVVRRWPSRLDISVTEQVPAACWGDRGLLNTRGELFVTDARHIPAELPRLSGPPNRAAEIAKRYLVVREQLIPFGLNLRRVHMDARGAWEITLQNGVTIRLGRREVEQRTELFLDVVAEIITNRAAEIDYVDMRYSNGFTIGWKVGSERLARDANDSKPNMMALRGEE